MNIFPECLGLFHKKTKIAGILAKDSSYLFYGDFVEMFPSEFSP